MNHIMLDLETLDTEPSAAVLQIGAVAFSETDGTFHPRRLFTTHLQVQPQINAARTVSFDTIEWWAKQSGQRWPAASDRTPVAVALTRFFDWAGRGEYQIWSHGASFDLAIMGSLARSVDLATPWSYRSERDTRTLDDAVVRATRRAVDRPQPEVPHDALSDALAQAAWTHACLAALREIKKEDQ